MRNYHITLCAAELRPRLPFPPERPLHEEIAAQASILGKVGKIE
jgi:hypothetical protein